MKYCPGKYHGKISKKIEDNEDYCPLCKKRMASVKKERKEKFKKALKTVGKGIIVAVPSIVVAIITKGKGGKNS